VNGLGIIDALNVVRRYRDGIAVPRIAELSQFQKTSLGALRLSPSGETLMLEPEDVHISTAGLLHDVAEGLPNKIFAARFGTVGGGKNIGRQEGLVRKEWQVGRTAKEDAGKGRRSHLIRRSCAVGYIPPKLCMASRKRQARTLK
jgi:hypothetical protein